MNRRFGSLALLSVLFAFVVYGTYIGLKNIIRYNTYRNEYKQVHDDYLFEVDRHRRLNHLLIALDSPAYWEKRAKEDLGYVKPNEAVIKFLGR